MYADIFVFQTFLFQKFGIYIILPSDSQRCPSKFHKKKCSFHKKYVILSNIKNTRKLAEIFKLFLYMRFFLRNSNYQKISKIHSIQGTHMLLF